MNESCTVLDTPPPVRRMTNADAPDVGSPPPQQQPQREQGGISSTEMAQKILRLTGNVRLTSRAAHNWHHCGINE